MSEVKVGSTVPLWTGGGGGGGGAPTGPAGGDLRATYPNPIVQGLQTVPIALTAPVQGQVLQFSGTQWHAFTTNSVIWRPGGVSADNVVTTWAEVETRITATQGFLTILVDTSLISPANAQIPATADTECFGRVVFQPYAFRIGNSGTIEILDGGRLRNPFTVRTVVITGDPAGTTVRPFILLDTDGALLIAREGGQVSLETGSTVPGISITGEFCELAQFEGGRFNNNTGNPALGMVDVDAAVTQVLHAIISAAGSFLPGQPAYSANLFQTVGAATILQIYDSSAPPIVQINWTGGYFPLPMSNAIGTVYQDALVTPLLGATEVQAALDILKRRVTGFGNTASRPAIPADIDTGGMYFDTDLGFPVYSDGAVYVDAAGAPA